MIINRIKLDHVRLDYKIIIKHRKIFWKEIKRKTKLENLLKIKMIQHKDGLQLSLKL